MTAPLPETLEGASAALRDRTIRATDLAEDCLERIATLNPALNAFITVTADLARERAAAADREIAAGHWRGPLHGVPIAVKDFFDTAGVRTTAAFAAFERRIPRRDAEIVAQLRDAGAVLLGKTNMHQLGMGTTSLVSHFGPVVNPLSARHVAGGSSGGSAAAIAARLCYATIDTDAVGSARLPAACCGVVALKPTYGRLSTAGILADQAAEEAIVRLGHTAITARTVTDVALVYEALAGGDAAPASISASSVAVVRNAECDDRTRAMLGAVASSLSSQGFELTELDVPFEEASFDVSQIEDARATISKRLFATVDVLLLPTLAADVPTVAAARKKGDLAVSPHNTFFCNYFGLPSLSMPFEADDGLFPVSLQIVGPHNGEHTVLHVARAAASATRLS